MGQNNEGFASNGEVDMSIADYPWVRFTPDAAPAADKATLFLANFDGTTKPKVGKP